jgi:hypothetical protein
MNRADPSLHWMMLGLAVAALVLAAVLQVDAAGQVADVFFGLPLPESCMFRRVTGAPCPGCGLTRCFICLVRGDVTRAWGFNPGGLPLFLVVIAQVPYRLLQLIRIRRQQEEFRLTKLTLIVCCLIAISLIGQWVLRLLALR